MELFVALTLLVALVPYACSEGVNKHKLAANQPVARAVYQPYNYQVYDTNNYDSSYGSSSYGSSSYGQQQPSTWYNPGSQHLFLPGGIYRPYDYSDSYSAETYQGYRPYNYDSSYKLYDNTAARYVKYPYNAAPEY
ncbi:hypothetical protein CEXT_649551 [Caerostris extrusa]|uniref:Uncharacterized protein n=1 Tax=Caerostris extrusa TaxID=172846 RepID=A0AAV4VHV2_CAEEX|nr:hypothetical protein CEXT_649551 [Caerostris extrusa]